jgi:hypothetical protein
MAHSTSYGLKKQLSSQYLGRETKCALYKMLIRPILTSGSGNWSLKWEDENILLIFERRILRRNIGPIKENGI